MAFGSRHPGKKPVQSGRGWSDLVPDTNGWSKPVKITWQQSPLRPMVIFSGGGGDDGARGSGRFELFELGRDPKEGGDHG